MLPSGVHTVAAGQAQGVKFCPSHCVFLSAQGGKSLLAFFTSSERRPLVALCTNASNGAADGGEAASDSRSGFRITGADVAS